MIPANRSRTPLDRPHAVGRLHFYLPPYFHKPCYINTIVVHSRTESGRSR